MGVSYVKTRILEPQGGSGRALAGRFIRENTYSGAPRRLWEVPGARFHPPPPRGHFLFKCNDKLATFSPRGAQGHF